MTIQFKPEDRHLDFEWWGLFVEEMDSSKSNKYHIGHEWSFNLGDGEIEEVRSLCEKYDILDFQTEAFCIFYKLKKSIHRRKSQFPKEIWARDIKPQIERFEKMWDASRFENIFEKIENIEYIKVKLKDRNLAYTYEGIPLDFIRQAVLEKLDRDKERFQQYRRFIAGSLYMLKEFAPNELRQEKRADEEHYAYHIFAFFKEYSRLIISDIDRLGAELMKLAGFEMPPDNTDPAADANDYKANFRKWRDIFVEKNNKRYQ